MNGLLASYTYGLERLTMNRVGGSVYTYTYDMGGSAADLVASNGMLVQAQTYTPFGTMEKIVETGFGGFNRQGFSGHEWDPESELTYAKHRFYDQDLGVFTSQDPVLGDFGTPPSLHRYQYGFHNPTRFHDPTGLAATEQYEEEEKDREKTKNWFQTFGKFLSGISQNILDGVDVMEEDVSYYQKWKWRVGIFGKSIGEMTNDSGEMLDLATDLTGGALFDYFEMDQMENPSRFYKDAKHDADLIYGDLENELSAYKADAEGYLGGALEGMAKGGLQFGADLLQGKKGAVDRLAIEITKVGIGAALSKVSEGSRAASRFGSKGPAKAKVKIGSSKTVETRSLNVAREPKIRMNLGDPRPVKDWRISIAAKLEDANDKIGHTMVAITDPDGNMIVKGFWPRDGFTNLWDPIKGIPAKVRDDTEYLVKGLQKNNVAMTTYPITSDQAKNALRKVEIVESSASSGAINYQLFCSQCTTFALDVLMSAGVKPPKAGLIARPRVLHESIKGLKND